MLKFIQNHGNVTTYEWRTGSKPVTIQEDWVVIDTKDEEDLAQNVDDVRQIESNLRFRCRPKNPNARVNG